MVKKTFKNITEEDLALVGIGIVKAGETFDIELQDGEEFHNANFEEVKTGSHSRSETRRRESLEEDNQ